LAIDEVRLAYRREYPFGQPNGVLRSRQIDPQYCKLVTAKSGDDVRCEMTFGSRGSAGSQSMTGSKAD
jgi:hypothetical protein